VFVAAADPLTVRQEVAALEVLSAIRPDALFR
jgi:hypothetical protein